jgi:hypothetical protein
MVNVVFKNQPKLSEYEIQKDFNERRLALIPHIKDFISEHNLFKDSDVSITFLEKGMGSLVTIIECLEKKLILKIPLSKNFSGNEGLFLKVWQQSGIRVPQVIEEGILGGHNYILMEYIDYPLLAEKYSYEEFIEKDIYIKMGRTLRLMHGPEAKGYGRVSDDQAEFLEFSEWLKNSEIQNSIKYIQENNLLGEEYGSIESAFKILTDHIQGAGKSSYCHNDFGGSNIFATDPITVFDPNPSFNNGYIDLGRSLFNHIVSRGLILAPEFLIKGYFGEEIYNKKALQASVLLSGIIKIPSMHKKNNLNGIKNIQEYLLKNKISS